MSVDHRSRLQAAMALLDECLRQQRLTLSGDSTVRGIAMGEAMLTAIKAKSQIEMVLREQEEEAA